MLVSNVYSCFIHNYSLRKFLIYLFVAAFLYIAVSIPSELEECEELAFFFIHAYVAAFLGRMYFLVFFWLNTLSSRRIAEVIFCGAVHPTILRQMYSFYVCQVQPKSQFKHTLKAKLAFFSPSFQQTNPPLTNPEKFIFLQISVNDDQVSLH